MANDKFKPKPIEATKNSFKKERRVQHDDLLESHDGAIQHDESNWLVSYADLMTLLFGFFVLVYSFSKVDDKKFAIVRKDVASYFGGQVQENPGFKKLYEDAAQLLKDSGVEKQVILVAREAEIELHFQGEFSFIPGTAHLTTDAEFVLTHAIELMKKNIQANSIKVEGHTDDSPIFSANFPSNWELSSARAAAIVREFEKYGFNPSQMHAEGFGSSRPLKPNRNAKQEAIAENQAINRRVIITAGFSKDVRDAVQALKTNEFTLPTSVSPNADLQSTALTQEGTGALTWREKNLAQLVAAQKKLKLAQERLRETRERNQAQKKLTELQERLQAVETQISTEIAEDPIKPSTRKPAAHANPKSN